MSQSAVYRIGLENAFADLRRITGRPSIRVYPWQVPSGLSYSSDLDGWIDGDGDIVTRTDDQLDYYDVPALWGEDAESLILGMGGISAQGGVVAVANVDYLYLFNAAMMIVADGERYTVNEVGTGPDGLAAFVVAEMSRRE